MLLYRKLISLLITVLLMISGGVAHAQQISEEAVFFNLLRGFMLNAQGDFKQGAGIVGEIGYKLRNERALKAAAYMAVNARDLPLAQKIVGLWAEYGSADALKLQAQLHILKKDVPNAQVLLKRLVDESHVSQQELFQQLLVLRDHPDIVSVAEYLFLDDAEGKRYIALLTFYSGDLQLASEKNNIAIAADKGLIDNQFLRALITQNLQDSAAALPIFVEYVSNQCYGGVKNCQLEAVLWAFSQYLNNRPWREAILNDEVAGHEQQWALSAAYWYQQWEMIPEAIEAFKRAGDLFMAKIALASLLEEVEGEQAALDVLVNVKTESNADYVLREVSIAHLLKVTQGFDAAINRLDNSQLTVVDNFTIMYNLALLYEEKGDIDTAIIELMELTTIHPNSPDAWNALGYVMADHNIELQKAKKHIEFALKSKPDDPNVIDSLGWVYYRLGNLERALFYLNKAAKLSPAPEILAHLGEVLWQSGDKNEAKRVWQTALKKDVNNKVLSDTISRLNAKF